MINFAVIFVCMLAGILFKKLRHFPPATAQTLNSFVIFLSLPCLILAQIPKLLMTLNLEGYWWLPVSMAWVTFGLSFLVFSWMGQKLSWSKPKTGALILTAGLGNTSFLGFPLLESLIGPQALPIGILTDQPGSFLVVSTVGILVAASLSGAQVSASLIFRKIITFPPFIALLLSIVWYFVGTPGFQTILPLLDKVSSTLVPLALFAVGFQLRFDFSALKKRWAALGAGLSFKLVLIPALFTFLGVQIFGMKDLTTQVTVLESAMAPMITSAVVAAEFDLDTELANLMVGIGIPLSLLTVFLWSLIVQAV